MLKVLLIGGSEMPGPSDASYGQQPPPSTVPQGPTPVPRSSSPAAAGFSQPPANQAMMPGFSQPSSGGPSSNSYPMAAPRSQPAAAAFSQPAPPVHIPQQPAGESHVLTICNVKYASGLPSPPVDKI